MKPGVSIYKEMVRGNFSNRKIFEPNTEGGIWKSKENISDFLILQNNLSYEIILGVLLYTTENKKVCRVPTLC